MRKIENRVIDLFNILKVALNLSSFAFIWTHDLLKKPSQDKKYALNDTFHNSRLLYNSVLKIWTISILHSAALSAATKITDTVPPRKVENRMTFELILSA